MTTVSFIRMVAMMTKLILFFLLITVSANAAPKGSTIIQRNSQGIRTGTVSQRGRVLTFRKSNGVKIGSARISRSAK